MRVCICCQANPFTWIPYYVSAFRRRCDVVTVGPSVTEEQLESWGRAHLAALAAPHDVAVQLDQVEDLYALLPRDWRPDLVVSISGGGVPMLTATSNLDCPTVFLSVDTWQCLRDYYEALHYDIVFAAQQRYVERLRAYGARRAYWLPLACDPTCHYPASEPTNCDITFVGAWSSAVHRERARLLDRLGEAFSLAIADRVHGEAMCRHFARGRLAFNHAAVQDVNMRIFEVLAMRRPLLTNRDSEANGLFDLFESGKHLIVYESEADLVEKARCYLQSPEACDAIAQAGYAEVLARHTYDHRVAELLATVHREIPGLQGRVNPDRRRGDRLADYLPHAPGRVLDIGLGLGASRVALRRTGATQLVGAAYSEELVAQRSASYDAVHRVERGAKPDLGGPYDTVVLADPAGTGLALRDAVVWARDQLSTGGTLVAPLSRGVLDAAGLPLEARAVGDWLRPRDLLVVGVRPGLHATGMVVTARRRGRRLRGILHDVYSELGLAAFPPEVMAGLVDADT